MEQRNVRWWAMIVLFAFMSSTFTVHAENTEKKHVSDEAEGEEADSSVKARQAADKLVSAKVPVDTIGRIMSDRDFSESISAAKFDKLLAKKELNISAEQKAALRESFKIAGSGRVFQQGLGNALSELQQPQTSPSPAADPKAQAKAQDPAAQAKADPSKDKAGDLTKQLQDALGLSKNGAPNQNELLNKLAGILDPKNQQKGQDGQGQGSGGGGAPGGGSPGGGSPGGNQGGNQGNQSGQALGAIANALKHGNDNKSSNNNNKNRSNSRGATSDDDKKKEEESRPKVSSSSDDSDSSVKSFLDKEKDKAKDKDKKDTTDLANLADQNGAENTPLPPPGRRKRPPSGPTSVPNVLPDSGFAGLPGLGGSFGSEPGSSSPGFGGAPIQGGAPGGGAAAGGGFDLASMRLEDNQYYGPGGPAKFASGADVYATSGAVSADSGSNSNSNNEPEGDYLPSADTIGKLATAGKVLFVGGIPTTVAPLAGEMAGNILSRNFGHIVSGFCKAETTRGNDFCVARRNKPSKKETVSSVSGPGRQDS